MPTVMAREWHDEVSVASHARPLFANSRVTRRLVSLPFSAVQLVGLELSWCRCRCRTFLEYGHLPPEPRRRCRGRALSVREQHRDGLRFIEERLRCLWFAAVLRVQHRHAKPTTL